ncbi:VIT family protein [Hirsutella rhossiliensis]|uniref:pyruvate, water dikinase n=1 Tax=Hirsutella rhossiliensis TaxID=111463 RepID=A0A9P8N8L1_9HYPO|nr:VIT family domain-containing protein [Hirsutella rhossiliensis]KAH0968815.1 VIT family domain-containing protein [Hirsutella rhossiliensis]
MHKVAIQLEDQFSTAQKCNNDTVFLKQDFVTEWAISCAGLFHRYNWPGSAATAIPTAYRQLSATKARIETLSVVVRSCAKAKDLPDASFAGQQETYLNISGEDTLLDACRGCYASLITDRAISCRQMKDHMSVALSIGMQLMKRSDKEMKMVYGDQQTPTRNVPIAKAERAVIVLGDDEVLALARWACAIEEHYGRPMDMEWAKGGVTGDLFIAQARPETERSRRDMAVFKTYEFFDGSILVTGATEPDWVPVMKRADAITTDHGGRTSHAAIVSRELGLPAIVGTGNATYVLHSGQDVTISCAEGDTGFVYWNMSLNKSCHENSPLLGTEPQSEPPCPGSANNEPPNREVFPSSSYFTWSSSAGSASNFGDSLRDVIIGFSDGLTVPFALTAGLSSLGSTRLVIMGGLAELFSGMISMGLGAYLAAATESDRCRSALRLRAARPLAERRAAAYSILARYSLEPEGARPLVDALCANGDSGLRFATDLALGTDKLPGHRAWLSGLTMGLSYFVGGLVPMLPYFAMARVRDALLVSIAVTIVMLLAFGYVKNYVAIRSHRAGVWGALQTLVVGVLAASTSYIIVKALDSVGPG